MNKTICEIVEENEFFIGKNGEIAITSPLLECAGLFIYSKYNKKGILAHWQNTKDIKSQLINILLQLKLKKPYAIIAGCGVPAECSSTDSEIYKEVRRFLNELRIPVKYEEVGLDQLAKLKAKFFNGDYEIMGNPGSLTTSYFAVAKYLKGIKISTARFNIPAIRNTIDEILVSFAPSKQLIMDYRYSKINWQQYRENYLQEQRKHYKEYPENFEDLLERAETENMILLCYEKFEGKKTKCHRIILFDLLKKIAENQGYEVNFINEEIYKGKK